jgi:hypothetical protein
MKCPKCGVEIAVEDKFCYSCGAKVASDEPAAEEEPVSAAPGAGPNDDTPAPAEKPVPKPDEPSTHPLATLIGYAHNGFGLLGMGALILIVGGMEVPSGSLPEEMAWLLLPVMWYVQPLGWLAALLPGLYLVTRRNATAKFHGKALIGLGFLVIVLAFFLIGVLAFADIGID